MKNTSFKRIWTKTSVKRILKEFSESTILRSAGFLCFGSPEFRSIWNNPDHKLEIRKLVKDFLGPEVGEKNEHNLSTSATNILFDTVIVSESTNEDLGHYDKRKKIRMDFLKHEIQRLSNKK